VFAPVSFLLPLPLWSPLFHSSYPFHCGRPCFIPPTPPTVVAPVSFLLPLPLWSPLFHSSEHLLCDRPFTPPTFPSVTAPASFIIPFHLWILFLHFYYPSFVSIPVASPFPLSHMPPRTVYVVHVSYHFFRACCMPLNPYFCYRPLLYAPRQPFPYPPPAFPYATVPQQFAFPPSVVVIGGVKCAEGGY
jgi:hypothetical protein